MAKRKSRKINLGWVNKQIREQNRRRRVPYYNVHVISFKRNGKNWVAVVERRDGSLLTVKGKLKWVAKDWQYDALNQIVEMAERGEINLLESHE